MADDLLTEVRQKYAFIVAPSESELDEKMAELRRRIDETELKLDSLFAEIETEAHEALFEKVISLKNQMEDFLIAKRGYLEQLSIDCLKLRDPSGFPLLIMVDLHQNAFRIIVEGDRLTGHFKAITGVPKPISQIYLDIMEKLGRKLPFIGERRISLEAKIHTILPETTRDKVREALASKLFEGIYIIAEAKDWKLTETNVVRSDPLVVGYAHKKLWIIDMYDPTPVEQYVREQFAWEES